MPIRLQGRTQGARHAAIADASNAIVAAGGYVLDYRQFSNHAVVFTLELPPVGFARLRHALAGAGMILDPPGADEAALAASLSEAPAPGTLRLEFTHDEPDLRIPIPAVPG